MYLDQTLKAGGSNGYDKGWHQTAETNRENGDRRHLMSALTRKLAAAIHFVRMAHLRWRTRAKLAQLSDHELADIGLRRGQLGLPHGDAAQEARWRLGQNF